MRSDPSYMHKCTIFGDCITADYFWFDRKGPDGGLEGMYNGLVMLDVATGWLDCEPTQTRDADIIEIH